MRERHPSSHQSKERANLFHEQLGLLEGSEVAAPVGLVPVADVREALLRPAPGRTLKLLGKIEHPVGTSTVSSVDPEIHSFTCLMLSQ